MTSPLSIADDPSEIAKQWYVQPSPGVPRGWLVYSREFILAGLQGCAAHPERVRATAGWRAAAALVAALLAVAQGVIMIFAVIPVIGWLTEILARTFTRGSFGFFFRAAYWKARLGSLGQNTIIDQGVNIWGASSVSIGAHCHIDANAALLAGDSSHGQHGAIRIGNFVHVGPGVRIAGRGGVEIGDFVGIAAGAHIYSATGTPEHPEDPGRLIAMSHMAPADMQNVCEAAIRVDEYAFIGMFARLLPGARVGRGAIVHAQTELSREIPPFANYGGLPRGRIIGYRKPRRISPDRARDET